MSKQKRTYSLKEGLRIIQGGLSEEVTSVADDKERPIQKETGARVKKVTAPIGTVKSTPEISQPKQTSVSVGGESGEGLGAPQMKPKGRRRGDTKKLTPVDLFQNFPKYEESNQQKIGFMHQILGMKQEVENRPVDKAPVEKPRKKKHTPTKQLSVAIPDENLYSNGGATPPSEESQVFMIGDDDIQEITPEPVDDSPTSVVSMDAIFRGKTNEYNPESFIDADETHSPVLDFTKKEIKHERLANLSDLIVDITNVIDGTFEIKNSSTAQILLAKDQLIDSVKNKFPALFNVADQTPEFMEELVVLTLMNWISNKKDNKEIVGTYIQQQINQQVDKMCQKYWLVGNGEASDLNLSVDQLSAMLDDRDKKMAIMTTKQMLQQDLFESICQSEDWIKMYAFFLIQGKPSDFGLGEIKVKSMIKGSIDVDQGGNVNKVWKMIENYHFAKNSSANPNGESHKFRNAIMGVLGIAAAATAGIYGYSKMNSGSNNTKSNEDDSTLVAKNIFPAAMKGSPAPMDNKRPEPKMVSGVMDVKKIDDPVIPNLPSKPKVHVLPNANQPSQIVSGVIEVKPVHPRKPKVPEVAEVAKSEGIGLVKIDIPSLSKMKDGQYKEMYIDQELTLENARPRSITGFIEMRLMKEAKTSKQKRAYRKHLEKLEKGWLIYMRQLELRVKKQKEKGEPISDKDAAELAYWETYKVNYSSNYSKARYLEKKHRKLMEKGKKNSNYKRYQEYADMGTSLMEGLHTLNPEIASVNQVENYQKFRIADRNGNVLEYLYEVSGEMGLERPDIAKVVAETPAPAIKANPKSKMVSGTIETQFELCRESDQKISHTVSQLENVFEQAPNVSPSMDFMGAANANTVDSMDGYYPDLFPWERKAALASLKEREHLSNQHEFSAAPLVEEIVIDASDWEASSDLPQTDLYANSIDIDASNWEQGDKVASNDLFEQGMDEDLYAEYKVEMNLDASDWEASSELPQTDLFANSIDIDASNWEQGDKVASNDLFEQGMDEDLYAEYKIEESSDVDMSEPQLVSEKAKKEKKGFFGKIKGWFKKKMAA
ncbi:hypothetical protein KKD70_01355 [Patescibacteria group bacterium]|nr:hypothetical protein [Patescibacteria group bacterium]